MPSKTLTRTHPLRNTLHRHRNINYIEFDDTYFFLVGFGCNRVSILRRDTGEVVWTLDAHVRAHGPPQCYRSAPLFTTDCHALLLREQVEVPPPPWLHYVAQWAPHDPSQLRYSWHAVHPDADTGTLAVLGESGVLLIPHYKAMLCGTATPQLYLHVFATERDACFADAHEAETHHTLLQYRRRPRSDIHGQLAAGNGRVAAVLETLTLLDLRTHTTGRDRSGERITVPFAAYEWSDMPNPFDWYAGPIDPFRGCSCVQMDATGLYCVTRQALDREVNVSPSDFPEGYQDECRRLDASMVTGFHFDDRAQAPRLRKTSDVLVKNLDDLDAWTRDPDLSRSSSPLA